LQVKPHSAIFVYAICIVTAAISLGCLTLLPEPDLSPSAPTRVSKVTVAPSQKQPSPTPKPAVTKQPTPTGVTVTRVQDYYQITGNTEAELRQQMNTLGPPDIETGKIFDARTYWVINWRYYYSESSTDCKIDRNKVEVSLTLTFTYPKWQAPSKAAPALVAKWNRYIKQLVTHEEGHASLANDGAQAVYKTIMAIPASATCDALEKATNAAADKKIDELKQRQKAYDDRTRHGETQGAVFP
jgi:predicted secreted Zn-dependent protease